MGPATRKLRRGEQTGLAHASASQWQGVQAAGTADSSLCRDQSAQRAQTARGAEEGRHSRLHLPWQQVQAPKCYKPEAGRRPGMLAQCIYTSMAASDDKAFQPTPSSPTWCQVGMQTSGNATNQPLCRGHIPTGQREAQLLEPSCRCSAHSMAGASLPNRLPRGPWGSKSSKPECLALLKTLCLLVVSSVDSPGHKGLPP